ncbi:MAG TPA: ATPase domain-containing protein [Nitrososphaerales archaeon]|nr:ATPase domain-containing protein [Nitrososphaerales archaeon]
MEASALKTRSGIQGFDEILLGGLPKGRAIILSGPPGSGKSTFAMQFLYKGVKDYGEPGVYVTLSESPAEIRNNMKSYGWDIIKLERDGKLLLVDARPFSITEEGFVAPNESLYRGEAMPFSHLTDMTLAGVRRAGAKRLVIDSVTILAMQYVNKFYIRQGLMGMVQALSNQDCTSLLISETVQEEGKTPTEWYIAHGVIVLHYTRKGDTMERAVQVIKMRGTRHGEEIYPARITENGFTVLQPRMIP